MSCRLSSSLFLSLHPKSSALYWIPSINFHDAGFQYFPLLSENQSLRGTGNNTLHQFSLLTGNNTLHQFSLLTGNNTLHQFSLLTLSKLRSTSHTKAETHNQEHNRLVASLFSIDSHPRKLGHDTLHRSILFHRPGYG